MIVKIQKIIFFLFYWHMKNDLKLISIHTAHIINDWMQNIQITKEIYYIPKRYYYCELTCFNIADDAVVMNSNEDQYFVVVAFIEFLYYSCIYVKLCTIFN